jgi:hypothetical protein
MTNDTKVTDISTKLNAALAEKQWIVPEVGIRYGVPEAEYFRYWPVASASALITLDHQSPAHLLASLDEPEKETPALMLGRAIHAMALEESEFAKRYVVANETCSALTKKNEPCKNSGLLRDAETGAWYCGTHAGQAVRRDPRLSISLEDSIKCQRIVESLLKHPTASEILRLSPQREVTIVWKDEITGLLCKMRKDLWAPELATIGDIKSTMDASKAAFRGQVASLHYHQKAAWYIGGGRAAGLLVDHFTHIAVEKSPPYAVQVFRLHNRALALGAERNAQALARLAGCLKTGVWPAYNDDVQDIDLPEYMYRSATTDAQFQPSF